MIQYYQDIQLYFGTKDTQLSLHNIEQRIFTEQLKQIMQVLRLDKMVLLHQTHSTYGYIITDTFFNNFISLYEHDGDYLLTDLKSCGLAVLTADCVPLIFYDRYRAVCGIVHAGWKGSVQGVVIKALEHLIQNKGAKVEDIEIFFGASAEPCCYEVSFNFKEQFAMYSFAQKAFDMKQKKLFFDNKLFIQLQLKEFGILPKNIYNEHIACSICDERYCSYRREKQNAGRQITLVALQ